MSSLRSVALAAPFGADIVAKRFCASEQATLIQDPASVCNVDSKIHSSRFDFCGFYSQTAARRLLQQNLPLTEILTNFITNRQHHQIGVIFRLTRSSRRCATSGGYKEALKSYGSTPQLVDPVIRDVPRLENQPERVRAGLQAPAWPQGLLLERQKGLHCRLA
jgi:hypothetical protein